MSEATYVSAGTIRLTVSQLEDGLWFADSPDARGCWGHGETMQEAMDEFCDTYREWVNLP